MRGDARGGAAVMAALLLTAAAIPAIAQTTATAMSPAAGTPTVLPAYEKYEPNYLVERYKSDPDKFSYGAMKNSSDATGYMIDHVGETFLMFTVMSVLGVIVLMCYNCMTCVKFDKPRRCCWGMGPKCCQKFFSSVIPGPFRHKIELGPLRCYPCRQLVRGFLVVLAIAIVGLSSTGAVINTDQGEALENIPNVLRSVADYVDGPVTGEIYLLSNHTAAVSGNLSALIRATSDEFTITPPNLTDLFNGASDDVLRMMNEINGDVNNNVDRINDELQDALDTIANRTNDVTDRVLTPAIDGALDVVRDLSDGLRKAQDDVSAGAAELNDNGRHDIIALAISFAIMCTLAMCAFAWINTGHKRLACTDALLCPCRKCKCEAHEASTTRVGCGRDLYRTNCLFSFCGLWFVLVCFVVAGGLFTVTTVLADFCAAPTSSLVELIDAAPVTYYLECHVYNDTRLRDSFPLNAFAVEIQDAFTDLDAAQTDIDDALRRLGASQNLLAHSAQFSQAVQLSGAQLSGDGGTVGYKGLAGCHHINPFLHELLIDLCTDFYSTVALFFELALILGCLCCAMEVCLKCSRRETKEYYNVAEKLSRKRKRATDTDGDGASDSESGSDFESASESEDEEPPHDKDPKEWKAFNARQKKRAANKKRRLKRRLKREERRLKKHKIRAEQKAEALQKAQITADKVRLKHADMLEKQGIIHRHSTEARAEKLQLNTAKDDHRHHVKDESGHHKDEVRVHKAVITVEKHTLNAVNTAHSAESTAYKASKRKIKDGHRAESAEFKHQTQQLKAKHAETELQYTVDLAAAEAAGDKDAIREIKRAYKQSGDDYSGERKAMGKAHRAGKQGYHAERKVVNQRHHAETMTYQVHKHHAKDKIKHEKAELKKESKHHKDTVKAENTQYKEHVAPLEAERLAEKKHFKDEVRLHKAHVKTNKHTLHDETAAMKSERKAKKMKREEKLRKATERASGDDVVATQPGRQANNPAYSSALPLGTPLDANGDVAYDHIYNEARFGFGDALA